MLKVVEYVPHHLGTSTRSKKETSFETIIGWDVEKFGRSRECVRKKSFLSDMDDKSGLTPFRNLSLVRDAWSEKLTAHT